ncbi:RCC1/BLIP-II [Xylaria nigripes]|nr:RCC1/BLIP-II [Xylaria nigripes]
MAPKPKSSASKGILQSSKVVKSASKVTKSTSKVTKSTATKPRAARAAATTAKATTKSAKTVAANTKAAKDAAPEKKSTATRKATNKRTTQKKSADDSATEVNPAVGEQSVAEKPAPKEGAKKTTRKRAIDDEVDDNEAPSADLAAKSDSRPLKKARVTPAQEGPTGFRKQVMLKRMKKPVVQNSVPQAALDVFVFGEGSAGELGLGSKKFEGKRPIDVKRPRINHNLDAVKVGVVDIACGGMHAIALTKDNRVLTWGVNDDKALGRDTTWSGGVRDADKDDSDSDDDDDDTGINPLESTPTPIENGELTSSDVICKVAACDSASFVLTTDGFVYGWGTFRGADGIIGFSESANTQATPVLIEPLQDITNIVCGSNHVIAMDVNGKVWTWGSGGQYQLGRKVVTRHAGPTATLRPQPCGKFGKRLHAVNIGAGSYHSFYIDNRQRIWSWGLNNYAQTGHSDGTGKDDAMILLPTVVNSLKDANVTMISGGEHHSVARTSDGKLLTWGRVDGHQVGHPSTLFNEDNCVYDDNNHPRILANPTQVPNIDTKYVTAGTDTSFAIDTQGRLYSWGFSANYQTGQGITADVTVPTLVDNSAIRDREMIWAGAGGQFSMSAAQHDPNDSPAVIGNGN